nr:hypothetical protein [Bacillus wiedmannii]
MIGAKLINQPDEGVVIRIEDAVKGGQIILVNQLMMKHKRENDKILYTVNKNLIAKGSHLSPRSNGTL